MRDCICVTGLLVLLWECISHLVKHEHIGVRPRSVVYVLSAPQNDNLSFHLKPLLCDLFFSCINHLRYRLTLNLEFRYAGLMCVV